MKTFECDNQDFEIDTLLDRKPVKLNKVIRNRIVLSFPSDQTCSSPLNVLVSIKKSCVSNS